MQSIRDDCLPECLQRLWNHTHSRHCRHKIVVPRPPGHQVPMQMPRHPRTGHFAEVKPDVESRRLDQPTQSLRKAAERLHRFQVLCIG